MVPYAIWIDRAARQRGIQNRLAPVTPVVPVPPTVATHDHDHDHDQDPDPDHDHAHDHDPDGLNGAASTAAGNS